MRIDDAPPIGLEVALMGAFCAHALRPPRVPLHSPPAAKPPRGYNLPIILIAADKQLEHLALSNARPA